MNAPRPLPRPLDSRAFSLIEAAANNVRPGRLRGKDLAKPTRGVRLHSSIASDLIERARAYQLAVPDAVVSHLTAAILWGFWLPLDLQSRPEIHVSRQASVRAVRRTGAVGHTASLAPSDIVCGAHVTSTAPERTWCDLASVLSLDELIVAGDFLLKRRGPLSSLPKLEAAVGRMTGCRGVRTAREALEWIRPRTDSAKETEVRLLLIRAGLPEPGINCAVLDSEQNHIEDPDMTYGQYKLALQYDGGHHISEQQRRWDISRDEQIMELGWRVLKLTQLDLSVPAGRSEPTVVSRTRAALLERGWVPNPVPRPIPGPSVRPASRHKRIGRMTVPSAKP